MDDAVRARRAACEAVADIEPIQLREALHDRLREASMVPAVLALLCARAVDSTVDADALATRAAGVQLIYEGLGLTRRLAHEEPWRHLEDGDAGADAAADLEILVADVLVSRGFYLLARTDSAAEAVDVVRSFGRDQTLRRDPGADVAALDRNLEADVFALAVSVGTTAVGDTPSGALLEYVDDLAREYGDSALPPASIALSNGVSDHIADVADDDRLPPSSAGPRDGR